MSHSSKLLAIMEACGDNSASQSMAFKKYIDENKDWAFNADSDMSRLINLTTNSAVISSYCKTLAEECGASSPEILTLFTHATTNSAVISSMCDQHIPYMSNECDISGCVDEVSNSIVKNDAIKDCKSKGGENLKGNWLEALGGFSIVSKSLAKLHLALKKIGNCDAGYEWNKGDYRDDCDNCKNPTGDGYNCGGGGHFVCMTCVTKAMGGDASDSDSDSGSGAGSGPVTLYDRDTCLACLQQINQALDAGENFMEVSGRVCQANGVDSNDSFEYSCKEHKKNKSDTEFANAMIAFEKAAEAAMGEMMGNVFGGMMGGAGAAGPGAGAGMPGMPDMSAMMGMMGGPPGGGAPGGNPMAAMMGAMGGMGGPPQGGGGGNPMGAMGGMGGMMGAMGGMGGGFGGGFGGGGDDDDEGGFDNDFGGDDFGGNDDFDDDF